MCTGECVLFLLVNVIRHYSSYSYTSPLPLPSLPLSSLSPLSHSPSSTTLTFPLIPGFQYAVESCQSLILASALLEGQLNVESATDLSRLETRHQVYSVSLSLNIMPLNVLSHYVMYKT